MKTLAQRIKQAEDDAKAWNNTRLYAKRIGNTELERYAQQCIDQFRYEAAMMQKRGV
jgi:hypothetical protein